MYAEVTSTAKEDNPHPAVEQFLALHAALSRASLITDSLAKTAVASPDQPPGGNPIPEEALKISADKRRRATSWVHAALATDLSPFSLYNHKPHLPPLSAAAAASTSVAVVVDGPSKTAAASAKAKSRSSPPAVPASSGSGKPLPATTSNGKARGAAAPPEWARGGGLEEGAELARVLREEGRVWFLWFVERFLDANVAAPGPSDREQVAGMLSQLKSVNDWLDMIGRRREGEAAMVEADGGGEGEGVPEETIERLRKKIYEYLLAHVESAAVALGGGSPAAAVGGGERPRRKG